MQKVASAHDKHYSILGGLSSGCILDNVLNDVTCAKDGQYPSNPYTNDQIMAF
jgi:hypothetical protein